MGNQEQAPSNLIPLEILDTTLRDGAQGEGITFSVQDKLDVVRALDDLGISWIEAGNPGSNPKDMEFFRLAGNSTLNMQNSAPLVLPEKRDIR